MGSSSNSRSQDTDSCVSEFMVEFAQFLVAAGVTNSRFSAIARHAYFLAATGNSKFRNNRLNQSAVAAMTGLTRSQVRAYAKSIDLHRETKPDRLHSVVWGWTADPVFTTSSGQPRRLSIGHKNATFGQLVRKYGGDIPSRSIVREMVRNGLATTSGGFIRLTRKAHRTSSQAQLQHIAQMLAKLIGQPTDHSRRRSQVRTIIREISVPIASSKGRALLQKKTSANLLSFISDLEAAGYAASIETPLNGKSPYGITRYKVVMMTEELESEDPGQGASH